jgi:IS605 OrfB family transposase
MQKTIQGTIHNITNNQKLQQLMRDFCSAKRFSYCRFKEEKELNDVRHLTKLKYPSLNGRYIYDAVSEGKAVFTRFKDQRIIFGSKKLWKQLINKEISKELWIQKRNDIIYSRGEKNHSGNANTRIYLVNNKLKLRINCGIRDYIYADVWLPPKYHSIILDIIQSANPCYSIRIKQEQKQCRIIVSYDEAYPEIQHPLAHGAIGIDLNPNLISLAYIQPDGNLIETKSILNNRINNARWGKRHYDIWMIANEVVEYAVSKNCGIVLEDLDFKKNKKYKHTNDKYNKKKNRALGNFTWKQLLTAIEAKAHRSGVEVKKVNPAWTSIIGRLKYCDDIKVHEAAAYVIGRRGLGYKERIPDWLRSIIAETLQEEGIKKSNWKIWSDLKKLTVPDCRAFVPRRVRRRVKDPPSGLMGNLLPSPDLLGLTGQSSEDDLFW